MRLIQNNLYFHKLCKLNQSKVDDMLIELYWHEEVKHLEKVQGTSGEASILGFGAWPPPPSFFQVFGKAHRQGMKRLEKQNFQ